MKRANSGIALVILGVVAIIAVIGLVMLFTKGSASGQVAANAHYFGAQHLKGGLGNVYGTAAGQPQGIGIPYPTVSGGPQMSYPSPTVGPIPAIARSTAGIRTPAYIILNYGGIEDEGKCHNDIQDFAHIKTADEKFLCVSIPTQGPVQDGYYPRSSAAYAQRRTGQYGKSGGNVYCYARSTGAEQQVPDTEDRIRSNLIISLVRSGKWTSTTVNGIEVPVCPIDLDFPFPQ